MKVSASRPPGRAWLLLCALLAGSLSHANNHGYRFQRFGAAEGLSQQTILCAHQDRVGFMWFCTQEGLNRFDGHEFRVFRQSEQTGLADSFVDTLAEESDGSFWIGTGYAGVMRFDPRAERFEPVPIDGIRPGFRTQVLLLEAPDRLWIGTDIDGLWLIEDRNGSRRARQVLPQVDVEVLQIDAAGALWIGTFESGLWRLPAGGARPVQMSLDPRAVRALLVMPDGTLWAGSEAGITVIDSESGATLRQPVPSVREVQDLLVDSRGRLWIATAQGLYLREGPDQPLRHFVRQAGDPYSLSENFVAQLAEDRYGNVWIGTWLAGVNLVPGHAGPFRLFNHQPEEGEFWNDSSTNIIEDRDGRIWTTFYRGVGLAYWAGDRQRWQAVIDPAARSQPGTDELERIVAYDRDRHRIWTFANNGQIGQYDIASGDFRLTERQPLAHQTIEEARLVGDRLYVATREAGSLILDADTLDLIDQIDLDDGLPINYVQASLMIGNRLWLGTTRGIALYDPVARQLTETLEAKLEGLSHNSITALHQAGDDTIWVGTQGGGLNRLVRQQDGGWRVDRFGTAQGLASDAIGGIRSDAEGNLWISTAVGITRLSRAGAVRNFGPIDGLNPGGFFIGSHAAGTDGRVYFGGHGVLAIDTGAYELPSEAPLTTMTGLMVRNQPVSVDERHLRQAIPWTRDVAIQPEDVLISLKFSALRFAFADDARYRYRIAELDPEWIDGLPGQNTAVFTHLPFGRLTFEVQASFDGLSWGPVTTLDLDVRPTVWRSWPAYALYLLAFFGVAALPLRHRLRVARLKREQQQALAVSEERLRMALWGSGDELWYLDPRSQTVHLTYFDRESRQFVSQEPEEVEERARLIHPEDRDKLRGAIDDHVAGKTDQIEVYYRVRAGSEGWHWYQIRGIAVAWGENGEVSLVAGTRHDVHRRLSAMMALEELTQHLEEKVRERGKELEFARDALVESEKMAALGNLVAGIAHELNTPIGIGLTAASHVNDRMEAFLAEQNVAPEVARTLREGMSMVIGNLDRATELIQSFKRVAVDQSRESATTFELRAYLSDIVKSLRPVYKNRYRVKVDCAEALVVHSYPSAFYQIIQNLVLNSATHGFVGIEHPEITIDLYGQGQDLVIDYRDNGRGIDASVREHIFEPFVTTARQVGSSGLGMHIVYNLVTQVFGGSIRCYEPEGKGAGFLIRIPLAKLNVRQSA